MNYLYDYSVIGGDLRQVYIANELSASGAGVVCHGLCAPTSDTITTNSLEVAIKTARCIICPIPFKQYDIINLLSDGQYFFAGCIPKNYVAEAISKGVKVYDLMENNSLAIYNSIATAEGAVCEAITRSPINLHHSKCAVLGYGRCGKTLCNYLKGMFCNVSVYVNKEDSQSYAATVCDRSGSVSDFEKQASDFDFVFNTIPAKVVTDSALSRMKSDVTIIDIASTPGGVDYAAAAERRINAALCLGLPGKYSPSSSAKAIINIIRSELSCL
ncbi:MAG: hypothetical protein IJB96_11460 [Lachnospira sp.]|nr:hypothetical protein [Lachnospira sp.]